MNKLKKYFDTKTITVIILVIAVVFVILGSTFAYWRWTSSIDQETSITIATNAGFTCSVDGGGDITNATIQFQPGDCTDTKHAIKRKITYSRDITQSNLSIDYNLKLVVNEMGAGLSNSTNFRYSVTSSDTSCETDVITSGQVANNVPLIEETYSSTGSGEAYLWIWLDAAEENSDSMNQEFKATLGGTCQNTVEPSVPVLEMGMIPVTIADNGKVTTVLNTDESWYNYKNKQWANAVLVTESSRANYLGTTDIEVHEDDILAYYVWIPRYKYKIWIAGASAKGLEQEIEIVFESKITPKSVVANIGDYYTHPAFTFGDTELDGFWVGKFETTGDVITPTIKPNSSSLRNQNVSTQFATALKFAGGTMTSDTGIVTFTGSTKYGLTANVDSHMIKNSEWGAVAYLSRSKYGINEEIRINNSFYTTGCGSVTENASSLGTCEIIYGSSTIKDGNKYPQSTTGNITGIFDMSGGAIENVMGNYNKTIVSEDAFTILPEEKYYNNYTITSIASACNGVPCYGHALSETYNWYSDYYRFFNNIKYPWLSRSGDYNKGFDSGVFYFNSYNGAADSGYSWRSVLTVG